MKKIYICHTLTAGGVNDGVTESMNVGKYLRWVAFAHEQGLCVISWVHNYLNQVYKLTDHFSYEKYMEIDKELLSMADEVWVGSDPADSQGVREEIEHAKNLGIPIKEVWKD